MTEQRRRSGGPPIRPSFAAFGQVLRPDLAGRMTTVREVRGQLRAEARTGLRREVRQRFDRWVRIRAAAPGGVLARTPVWSRLRHLTARRVGRLFGLLAALRIVAALTVVALAGLPVALMTGAGQPWPKQVVTLAVAFVALTAPLLLPWRGSERARLTAIVVLLAASAAALTALPAGWSPGRAGWPTLLLQVVFGQWVLVMTVLAGVAVALPVVRWWRMGRQPEIEAVECLAGLLITLLDDDLAEASARRSVAYELDRLADVFEHGYARALELRGTDTGAEVRRRLRRIAAGIRAQQVAVALPDVETAARLRRQLLACTAAVATGRLGSLAGVLDAEPRAVRRRVLGALAVLRSVVIALLPGVAAVGLHRAGLLPWDDELGRGVAVGAAVWALATLLLALDPQFGPRLRATQDLLTTLRGGPKT